MSKKSKARQKAAAVRRPAEGAELRRLLETIRNIPGKKVLTLQAGGQVWAVITAHEDGSLYLTRDEAVTFGAMLKRLMADSGHLVIRAFDEGHPTPLLDARGWAMTSPPRQKLYGLNMGGGTWRALSAEELRDASTTCPCCSERTPLNPDLDFFDLRPFVTTSGGTVTSQQ